MNRKANAVATIIVVLFLTGCTTGPSAASDTDKASLTLKSLADSVAQNGLEMYGGAAGTGGREQSVQIALPLGRDGLSVSGRCSGGEGTALVSLNEEGPFELSCTTDGSGQEITDSLPLQGIHLLITVEGGPANSTWAVAATNSP